MQPPSAHSEDFEPRKTIELGDWTIEIGNPSRTAVVVTLVVVLLMGILLNSIRQNHGRAEDWRQQAVAAEEVADGLRVVLAERSRELNRRTAQANQLVASLDSSRGALRDTKVSVGSLARRQREIAADKTRVETQLQKLATRQATLASVAAALNTCTESLEALVAQDKAKAADKNARLEQCSNARARLVAFRESAG
jgi:chromosome segregation ATPase